MKHRCEIERYAGTLTDLAHELGDLRYDALTLFLKELAAKLTHDAEADAERNRQRLAGELNVASGAIQVAAEAIERAWRICEPRMAN